MGKGAANTEAVGMANSRRMLAPSFIAKRVISEMSALNRHIFRRVLDLERTVKDESLVNYAGIGNSLGGWFRWNT